MSIFLAHNHKMLKSAGRYVGWVRNNLPPLGANSIRVKWKKGYAPKYATGNEWTDGVHAELITCVDPVDNIYDITNSYSDWSGMFAYGANLSDDRLIEILEGNLQNITSLQNLCVEQRSLKSVSGIRTSYKLTRCMNMFLECSSLTQVPLFDTSEVEVFSTMFRGCTSLRSVPAYDTSKCFDFSGMFLDCHSLETIPQLQTGSAYDVSWIFQNCYKASAGILSMYNQMSTQANPPSRYTQAFKDCGRDSVTGSAELAQIPSSWK